MVNVGETYRRDGFVSAVPVLSPGEATEHRALLEAAEEELGPLHYLNKISTLLPSAHIIATSPAVLDVVEQFIGPDILLYNATYIIKEPQTDSHVAWHQDLTYWGLSDDDAQVSMWLALAPATEASGCMKFLPGSHLGGRVEHVLGSEGAASNILLQNQRIDHLPEAQDGQPSTPVLATLKPGEASFHHGWAVHSSAPNRSDDRRIGLNVQYLAPHNRTEGNEALTALLVRGEDRHSNFGLDPTPSDLSGPAIARWRALNAHMKAGFQI